MTKAKKKADQVVGRRRAQMDERNPGEVIDPIQHVEIPIGTRKLPSVSQQIQEQIAIQIAKKQPG